MTYATGDGAPIKRYPTLFWDFDGVIKESVAVKSEAFAQLFGSFGARIAARVREHHERHGGLSRFEKIPLYLEWAGCERSPAEVSRYCELFSSAVRQAVIDCAWVPGVYEYLQANHARQYCVLITATPQSEIEDILGAIGVKHWFREVYGAPTPKQVAVASTMGRLDCSCEDALLIGDSEADFNAAHATGIDFLLRRTSFNRTLQQVYIGPQCVDFSGA